MGQVLSGKIRRITLFCRTGLAPLTVLLDTYSNNGLKAQEREKRGADSDVHYFIGGPDQNPGVSNERCMKSSSFKNELGKFLIKEWQNEEAPKMRRKPDREKTYNEKDNQEGPKMRGGKCEGGKGKQEMI